MPPYTLNETVIIQHKRQLPIFWRCRSFIHTGAIISIICVIGCIVTLYSHYGPLTPNGNRYYHDFDLSTVPFHLVGWSVISMALLYYPTFRFYHSKYPECHVFGIFPSSNTLTKFVSVTLTIMNIGSGFLFTILLLLETIVYCNNTTRVMAEDLETGICTLAFSGCVCFWGIIDLIYTLIYRKNW